MKELLHQPWPWALVSGAALVAALALRPQASGWLFWGLTLLSCAGAALVLWLSRD